MLTSMQDSEVDSSSIDLNGGARKPTSVLILEHFHLGDCRVNHKGDSSDGCDALFHSGSFAVAARKHPSGADHAAAECAGGIAGNQDQVFE